MEITLTMDKRKAEDLSFALADILCWLNGYEHGKGESLPVDTKTLIDFNIDLKNQIAKK